jgi:hypothetical protein
VIDLQHHLWLLMLKNKLYLAPISNPQRVLDIGTGTGIWAIDFGINLFFVYYSIALTHSVATQNPSADVLGTDLSPIQPPLFVKHPQRGSIALTDFQPVFLLTAGLKWMMQKMIGRLPKSLISFTDDCYSLPSVAQQKPSRIPTMLSFREAIWKCKKFILNCILSMIVPKAQL